MGPNLQKLIEAGMIVGQPDKLSADLKQRIETLSEAEIEGLVSAKQKLLKPDSNENEGVCF